MPEPREPQSIIEAAEQAAAAGNYSSAEALLREAAALQEAGLGPLHPDLANTLNNLGVVCEVTGKTADAEHCFRRAVHIATAVLKPDHPFVATSQKNLREFCEATASAKPLSDGPAEAGPYEPDSPAEAGPHERDSPAEAGPYERASLPDAEPQDGLPPVTSRFFFRLAIGALGPAAMVIVVLTTGSPLPASTEQAEVLTAIAMSSPLENPTPPHLPAPTEPVPSPVETTKTSRADSTKTAEARSDAAIGSPVIESAAPARPTVLKARLCAELDEWHCDPADRPVPPGSVFFYSQIKSTRATTVRHRWYQNDRLHQSVDLRVQPNPSGYRTYSRSIMSSDSEGSWRIEIRTADGVLLHEERFTVGR